MTANEMLKALNEMSNKEKNEYFDKGFTIEHEIEHARILKKYYEGDLIEVDGLDRTKDELICDSCHAKR